MECLSLTVPFIVVSLNLLHPLPRPMSRTGSSKSHPSHITSYPLFFSVFPSYFGGDLLDIRLALPFDVSLFALESVGWLVDQLQNKVANQCSPKIPTINIVIVLNSNFDVNFFSIITLVQHALPALRESKGRVIFVSSGAAVNAYHGWGAYCA